MPSKYKLSNSLRRVQRANLILSIRIPVMRPCQSCASRQMLYVISSESEYCEQYIRFNRQCDLASPHKEIERLYRQKKELFNKAQKAKTKAIRYNKQRRLIIKRLKKLGRREDQNILKLKIDEMINEFGPEKIPDLPPNFLSKALNSLSPRSVSFITLVEKKRSTDPFFKLLNSPSKSVEMPQNNS
jgi:hypothetical protein